ncbi:hypothetical protein [Pseudomonas fluorescens]|nr:hypothetical protein [Pseudomonas fluorescens]
MKPAPPLAPPELHAAENEAETTQRIPREMRQILHAMGLYLDSLQASAAIVQRPVLRYLQDSVLSLGSLLNELHETPLNLADLPPGRPSAGLQGMSCLVISDNPDAVYSTVKLLQAWGCRAQGAAPTSEAPALLSSATCYELVLCDLYQQDRDLLLSLLEQVHRLQPRALPIIVERVSVVGAFEDVAPTRLPRPLAPAKLRALLLASRLRP